MKKGSFIKDFENASNNLECNIFLKNHVHFMRMKMIMEWSEFFDFIASILYLYVAWLSGILLGYIIGIRNGGDL